ncbi:MAG TPA: hypothetical protein VEZ13_13530 [Brevibacillus sp.]|nr:hypothetical protein [Brevibacillus sp.]
MTAIKIYAEEGKSFLDLFLPLIDSEIERVMEELNDSEYNGDTDTEASCDKGDDLS